MTALDRLAAQVSDDLSLFTADERQWVEPRGVANVVIVGGGQSGLGIAHALQREGVDGVVILDRAQEGAEGVWEDFARMAELRTPKTLTGLELGLPNLSVRRFIEALHGEAAWARVQRIARTDWAAYLAWYRRTIGLAVRGGCRVTDVRPEDGALAVEVTQGGRAETLVARIVVLATGYDGAGGWAVPKVITRNLPKGRYDHANGPVDFARLKGLRVGVLGHGASAFDNAVAALKAGARSVDLCFRRERLPTVNPHRHIEHPGFMTHYPELADETRWMIARHFRAVDQPPAEGGYRSAMALDGFRLHPGTPWLDVALEDGAIRVTTPHGGLTFDHVIAATGARVALEDRPELTSLAPVVARWSDRYHPRPEAAHETLAAYPYLGAHYEFIEKERGAAPWVSRVFAFNACGFISMGPHSTSISGHRHALPRVVRGVTRRLFLDQESSLIDGLKAYDDVALELIPEREIAV